MRVIFNKNVNKQILDVFGMKVSEEKHNKGIIVYQETSGVDMGEEAMDPFGDPVHIDEFAGFMKGKDETPVIINSRIHTLLMLADQMVK